jgi:hypothetical protein
MRDRAISLEQDPASDRLPKEAVIGINRMHMDGEPWDKIADQYRISRKQVQRIVQGRRHASLHPLTAPHFYESGFTATHTTTPNGDRFRYIANAINDFYGRGLEKDTPESLALAAHILTFLKA